MAFIDRYHAVAVQVWHILDWYFFAYVMDGGYQTCILPSLVIHYSAYNRMRMFAIH